MTSRDRTTAVALAAIWALLIVGVVHGALGFGCYLVNEHRRMAWYEIVVLWLGDIITVFWLVRFTVLWLLGKLETCVEPVADRRIPRSAWLMLLSLAIGIIAEFGLTLRLRNEEFNAFGRAVPANCTIRSVHVDSVKVYTKLDGEFTDAAGRVHPVTYYVRTPDEMSQLPPPIAQLIQQGRVPLQLPIVYDPSRPGRNWIPEKGWDDDNRFTYFSILVLLFQFLFGLAFFFVLSEQLRHQRQLPRWASFYTLLPLVAEAFVAALFGAIELYANPRLCP